MIKKILVPLDGSDLARNALPFAQELAHKFEATIILVRALQLTPTLNYNHYPGYPYAGQYNWQIDEESSEANLCHQYLQEIQKTLQGPSEIAILADYPAADAIVDYAHEQAVDLIVMSTHGRSGVSRWVFGSVANKVLQEAPCPIYLVRASVEMEPEVQDQAEQLAPAPPY